MASGRGRRNAAMFEGGMAALGMQRADDLLSSGLQTSAGLLQQNGARYEPLAATANRGYDAYADRAGINGADGQTRAMEGFNNSVYGKAGEDYGAQAAMRQAANAGVLGSGRTMAAIGDYVARNRGDNYSRFTALASPYLSLAPQVAQMQGQNTASLASLYSDTARARAANQVQGFNAVGSAGAKGLAVGDEVKQQNQNMMMAGLNAGISGLSALAGGAGGLGNMFSGLFSGGSAMSTVAAPRFSGTGPILPGYQGQYLGTY
jgi:hypothetical protein